MTIESPRRDSTDRLAAIHAQLTRAVEDLAGSDAWRKMLAVAARFPTYSPSNVLLIALQRPDATRVAGLRMWNSMGRRVLKGEKGIAILAPCLYRGNDTDSTPQARGGRDDVRAVAAKELRGFRVVHVFDVSQTDGEPLPDVAPELLAGAAPEWLWNRLAALVEGDGFALERGDCRGANGHTRFDDRVVRVRGDVEPAQAAKTLAHELGHIRAEHETRFLNREPGVAVCRGVAEVEAESIAYLVTTAAGMYCDAYSVPYVAGWSGGDCDVLRATASRVLTVARTITTELSAPAPSQPWPGDQPLQSASHQRWALGSRLRHFSPTRPRRAGAPDSPHVRMLPSVG